MLRRLLLIPILVTGCLFAQPVLDIARAAIERHDCGAAIRELTPFVGREPASVPGVMMLGFCLTQAKRYAEADTAVSKALAAEPKVPDLYELMAQIKEARGDDAGCARMARKALTLMPPSDPTPTHTLACRCLMKLRQAGEADQVALSARPGPARDCFLATLKLKQQDEAGAAELARHALEQKPGLAAAELILGKALTGLGQYEEAESALKNALSHLASEQPPSANPASVYEALGQMELDLDRLPEAIGHFTPALEINSQSVPALLGRARALERSNQSRQAMTDAEKALQLDPESVPAHTLLLQIYRSLDLPKKAEVVMAWLEARNKTMVRGTPSAK